MFDKLKSLLQEKPAPYIFTPDVFPQIDRELMKRELKLAERGRQHGLKCLPSAPSDDSVESDIIARFEEERHKNTTIYREQLATFNKRLTDLNLLRYFSNAIDASELAVGEFNAEIQKRQSNLTAERENVIAARLHYTQFRTENRLSAAPNIPESLLFNVSIVIMILALEGVMNGFFFKDGSSNGLLGGIKQALLFSFANVGLSVGAGFFVAPNLYHIKRIRKVAGAFLMLCYLLLLLLLNLLIAHYRDAIQIDPDTATRYALTTFISNPVDLQDIQSIILVFIGSFLGLASMVDGLHMDDKYPGYGRLYRQTKRIYQEYNEKVDEAIDALTEIRDEAIDTLQQTREESLKRKSEYDAIQANRSRLIAQFSSYLEYLETAANDLITFYRNENISARSNCSAPHHFTLRWKMPRSIDTVETETTISPTELEVKSDSIGNELKSSIQALYESYDKSLPKFEKIGEL